MTHFTISRTRVMRDVSPCMGGWCSMREKCAHYATPTTRLEPAERLCDRGRETRMHFSPAPLFVTAIPSQQVGE